MLYIVSTPIGNLKDISERALETLRSVDVIIAESPNDSVKLLSAYQIKGKRILKFNDRNKKQALGGILEIVKDKDCAYISSAGTPGISDPGQDLVALARKNGIDVRVIPGPSALISAIAMSGIRARQFTFVSFPPKKQGQLKKLFEEFAERKEVLVFFESTHRILKTLAVLAESFDSADVFVAKEMTKIFENYFRGKPAEIIEKFKQNPKSAKGEFVIVVDFASYPKNPESV
jgi:16S rRNA (cytidine1402-2'-O)-methyltransferase